MYFIVPRSTAYNTMGVFSLGFAGFSFFSSTEETEEEEEDPLIILLKYAKLYQIRNDFELASDYYHKALALLLEREDEGEWTDDQVAFFKKIFSTCIPGIFHKTILIFALS